MMMMMMMMMKSSLFGQLGCGRPLQGREMYSDQSRMCSHNFPVIEESGHPRSGQDCLFVVGIGEKRSPLKCTSKMVVDL
jgi:hypothetical protein